MLPPLPRCSGWASSSLVSPNRVSLPRFHVRVGLHIVLFEVCSAFTRVAACTLARSPYVVTAIRRLQTLRLLHVCSGRFRLERSPGGACTHWKSAALSRRTWIPGIPDLCGNASVPIPVMRTGFAPTISGGRALPGTSDLIDHKVAH